MIKITIKIYETNQIVKKIYFIGILVYKKTIWDS